MSAQVADPATPVRSHAIRYRRVPRRTGLATLEVRKNLPDNVDISTDLLTAHWLVYHEFSLIDLIKCQTRLDNAVTEQEVEGHQVRVIAALSMLMRDNAIWKEMPIETFIAECRALKLTWPEEDRAWRLADVFIDILYEFRSETDFEMFPDYTRRIAEALRSGPPTLSKTAKRGEPWTNATSVFTTDAIIVLDMIHPLKPKTIYIRGVKGFKRAVTAFGSGLFTVRKQRVRPRRV